MSIDRRDCSFFSKAVEVALDFAINNLDTLVIRIASATADVPLLLRVTSMEKDCGAWLGEIAGNLPSEPVDSACY